MPTVDGVVFDRDCDPIDDEAAFGTDRAATRRRIGWAVPTGWLGVTGPIILTRVEGIEGIALTIGRLSSKAAVGWIGAWMTKGRGGRTRSSIATG